MFGIHSRQKHGVDPFNYSSTQWDVSNCFSSNPIEDSMQKLGPLEIDIQTYVFKVHKGVGFQYFKVMFRVHNTQRNGVVSSHYFTPRWDLSNGLLSNPNGYHMQMLCP